MIDLNTTYLRDFLSVAKYLNFTSASEACFVSAATLSKHIASLEEELNFKLFNRTTRSVTLTEYGQLFVQFATQIIETENTFRKTIASLSMDSHNTLRILAIPVILHYGVVEKLSCFRAKHPEIDLQITECQPLFLEEKFKEGIFDIAICGRPIADSGMKRCRIVKSNLVAVMRRDHPLAGMKSINTEQLRGENILLLSEATNLYEACINRLSSVGCTPKVVYKGTQQDIILELISQGMGIGLMVRSIVEYYKMDNICCIDIDPMMEIYLNLEWLERKPLKPSAKLLIQYLTE